MIHFRTEILPDKPARLIGYADSVICMGSCFAENVGSRFQNYRFRTSVNPFGILFNPMSVASSLNKMMGDELFQLSDLVNYNGLWHSFSHHGSFSSSSSEQVLNAINSSLVKAQHEIRQCQFLFLTFGTSWVYELVETQQIVANCHKMPDKYFNRFRLSVDRIVEVYKNLLVRLLEINHEIRVVLTVSPVRHWKDGAHGNQLSKSVLLLAIDQLEKLFECVSYFPSYELLLDDLRDYRFYDEDMLHPSSMAIDYVWERFAGSWLNDEAKACCKALEPIVKGRSHRPLRPDSDAYRLFLQSMLKRVVQMKELYPQLNLDEDKQYFESELLKNY